MGFDNGAGDGAAEAGPILFAVGDEGIEEAFADGFRDAAGIVFDFDDDHLLGMIDVACDADKAFLFAEGLDGIVEEILEDAEEFGLGTEDCGFGQFEFHGDVGVSEVGLIEGAELLEEFAEGNFGFGDGMLAAGELGQLGGHGNHPVDLFFDILTKFAGFLVAVALAEQLGAETDEAERVFKVVNDGIGHAADQGHFFLLEAVINEVAGCFVEMFDDGVEETLDGAGEIVEVFDDGGTGEAGDDAVGLSLGAEGAAVVGKDADLAEILVDGAGADREGAAITNLFGEGDGSLEDEVDVFGKVAFLKNDGAGRQFLDNGVTAECVRVSGVHIAEKRMLFQFHKRGNKKPKPEESATVDTVNSD